MEHLGISWSILKHLQWGGGEVARGISIDNGDRRRARHLPAPPSTHPFIHSFIEIFQYGFFFLLTFIYLN